MPTYDYVCSHCGHRFEVIHGVNGTGPTHCPVCHKGPVRKGFAPPTFHFKGSGWAKKDRGATARKIDRDAATAGRGSDGASDKAISDSVTKSAKGEGSSSAGSSGGSSGEAGGSGSSPGSSSSGGASSSSPGGSGSSSGGSGSSSGGSGSSSGGSGPSSGGGGSSSAAD